MRAVFGVLTMIAMLGISIPPAQAEWEVPPTVLVTPAEVAAVEARVLARVEAYRAASCLRPVLRGAPAKGSGTEAVQEIGEGAPPWQRCISFLEAEAEGLATESSFETYLETGEGVTAELAAALEEACGDLAAGVRAAVAHEEVCSPWRPGVRGNPAFVPLMRTSKAAVILGRTGYTSADALGPAREALDRMRFDQDVIRGGGTLIAAMISTASTVRNQAPWLRWILDRGDLSEAGLTEVVDSLGVLLSTEPPIGAVIEADGYWSFLQLILPPVKGKDWVPPGGWDFDYKPRTDDIEETGFSTRSFIDPKTDAALMVVAMDEIQKTHAAACPVDASVLACMDGLRRYGEAQRRRDGNGTILRAIKVLGSPDPRMAVRRWIVDVLSGMATPSFGRYVEKYAVRSFTLAALRIHAAVLRAWRSRGACETDLTGEGWEAYVADPIFDGPLRITRDPATAEWLVRAAGSFELGSSANEELEYRFNCPPGGAD